MSEIKWEHDCKTCLYNTEPKAKACEECRRDLVGVVRCKDCKWYEIAYLKRDGTDDKRHTPSVCVRGEYAKPRKADWYCADGERREDEAD